MITQNLLATAQQMRAIDRAAIEGIGIPGVVLMENAGKGTVDIISSCFGDLAGKVVAIVAGSGNNGGDGFVIARHLHQLGALVNIVLVVDPAKIKGDAALNYQVIGKLPIPISLLLPDADFVAFSKLLASSALIVDALLGTGLQRFVEGHFGKVIELVNGSGRSIVAVDIPSGLDSDSGRPLGACVRADITVTYGLLKLGQVMYPGVEYCGDLHLVDIGIPPQVVLDTGVTTEFLQKDIVAGGLPSRGFSDHKGTFGHALIVAGSQGKTGAAILAAQGALRSGCGLVSLCVPGRLNGIVETSCWEAMTIPMGGDWFLSIADYPAILNAMQGKDAILIGPGIGLDPETTRLVKRLYLESPLPMVVDADGLNNLLAYFRNNDAAHAAVRVLTPHPGEMARLAGITTKEVQADRINVASKFAMKNGVVLVLKGAATVIADPDGRIAVNPTGNPAMASGGMGDVLAGVIASLLAQGISAWHAACFGAYVHGLAADRLVAHNQVSFGILASEVANELPLAFKDVGL